MATEVERDRLPSAFGHGGSGAAPGSAGLAAAVQEHHGRRGGSPIRSADDATPPAGRGERLRRRSHGIGVPSRPANARIRSSRRTQISPGKVRAPVDCRGTFWFHATP